MFNRSEVLRSAWSGYRRDVKMGWGVDRYGPFDRAHFAYCLRMAWAVAKERAAKAARPAPQTMLAKETIASPRADAIRAELLAMDFSDAPTNWTHRRALNTELAALTGTGA